MNDKEFKARAVALLTDDRELTEEQKAKLEEIFPELRQSEDERIRKALIDWFKEPHASEYFCGIPFDKITAWLEKQGEQKPAEWSDDDVLMIDSIIQMLEPIHNNGATAMKIAWLKKTHRKRTTTTKAGVE